MLTGLVQLDSDHPGFQDSEYRRRRDEIAQWAVDHRQGQQPDRVQYTAQEVGTWKTVFRALTKLYPSHACAQYNQAFAELGYSEDRIPQLAEVSEHLGRLTGFRLVPVAGLVSPREFLTQLSERAFLCTQYIRHRSKPHYTPEPDVVHELLGHAPMLVMEEFAELSARLGRGAEKATDTQVQQIAALYWYTVEYGVVREAGQLRAYGAGLLSSFGELSRVVSGGTLVRPFDPEIAAQQSYPITSYQPVVFEVESIRSALEQVGLYIRSFVAQR
jgi:phenylalanine-4-hydroxylase